MDFSSVENVTEAMEGPDAVVSAVNGGQSVFMDLQIKLVGQLKLQESNISFLESIIAKLQENTI